MNRNKKSRYTKKSITAAVCFSMVLGNTLPVIAAENPQKEENVYASLEEDGTVSGVYVVNEYDLEKDTRITDYGDYTEVTNLTTEDKIEETADGYTVEGKKGKFYYQGNLETKELPWKIQISYYLNGEKKNPKELAGESGNLEIRISVKKNEKVKGDYFEDYLLQATVTLDSEKCKNIQAEGATLANVGADKQILYNIMAGQEKEFSITSEVTDFEMEGISFQGVPMSFAIDTDSLDMTALYEQTDELKEAVSRLDEGAGSLKEGTGELAKGSSRLLDATGSLAQGAVSLKTGTDGAALGSSSLVRGSQELETGIGTYLNGVSSAASGSKSLIQGADSLKEGAPVLEAGAGQLAEGTRTYTEGTESYIDGVQAYISGVEQLKEGAGQLAGLKNLGEVSRGITVLKDSSQQLTDGAAALSDGLEALLSQLRLLEDSQEGGQLQEMLGSLQEAVQAMDTVQTKAGEMFSLYNEAAGELQKAGNILSQAENELQSQADRASDSINQAGASLQSQADSANVQISQANSQIEAAADRANAQIDAAIAAVQNSIDSGAIDPDTGSTLIAGLDGSRVNVQGADAVSVDIPETEISINNDSSSALASVASRLEEIQAGGTGTVNSMTEELNKAAEAGENLPSFQTGDLSQFTESIQALTEGARQLETGLEQMNQGLTSMETQTASLPAGAEGIDSLLKGFDELTAQNQTLEEGGEALKSSSSALNQGAEEVNSGITRLNSGISALAQGAQQLDAGLEELEEKGTDIQTGSSSLTEGTQALLEGLTQLQEGVDTLSSGASVFETGISSLAEGSQDLDEGAGEMKGGTEEFKTETADIDTEIENKVEEMVQEFSGEDYVPVSFVSEKNTNVEAVQFAFQTDPIQIEEEEAREESPAENTGFWEKIRGLFE
ncbi:MAG TPA: hypothetical protein H9935_09685 [Candidatus Blautia merdigallinarum]|uniref:X-X-X-Leu-X-X-Gly heptad repeats n=1 Tax=Candidatus Blautia merdigallinarum TaxID=2838495 RepID=A0A9D2N7I9_9FIRM|nr:hypothetical protein [Candidatus Blautia merdigallinarum]